ncbi:MAG: FadR family transcriptional regulator [Anaerolineae bacterium]|nr:FadR family transcriptional regulator [Anaerolineae bacterium]
MPTGLSSSTLVEDVTEEIRQMILTGQIKPGEFVPTRKELAAQFGVGLSTVQEAIQALSAVGMLASRAGKGTWVREDALDVLIHPEAVRTRLGELNARKVYEARRVVEIALTEMAAKRATPEDIERIWHAMHRMEANVHHTDAFVRADLDFHLGVARASKNELLEQFYHLARKLLVEVIHELVSLPRVQQDSIPFQRAILEAIEKRDPELARQAAEEHMAYVEHLLDKWLE